MIASFARFVFYAPSMCVSCNFAVRAIFLRCKYGNIFVAYLVGICVRYISRFLSRSLSAMWLLDIDVLCILFSFFFWVVICSAKQPRCCFCRCLPKTDCFCSNYLVTATSKYVHINEITTGNMEYLHQLLAQLKQFYAQRQKQHQK